MLRAASSIAIHLCSTRELNFSRGINRIKQNSKIMNDQRESFISPASCWHLFDWILLYLFWNHQNPHAVRGLLLSTHSDTYRPALHRTVERLRGRDPQNLQSIEEEKNLKIHTLPVKFYKMAANNMLCYLDSCALPSSVGAAADQAPAFANTDEDEPQIVMCFVI